MPILTIARPSRNISYQSTLVRLFRLLDQVFFPLVLVLFPSLVFSSLKCTTMDDSVADSTQEG